MELLYDVCIIISLLLLSSVRDRNYLDLHVLDLFAVFDTIDHDDLFMILESLTELVSELRFVADKVIVLRAQL